MKLYHVALNELEALIRKEGLDPEHRAIALHREPPEVPDGFDVWAVEADLTPANGETALCPFRIDPDRLEMLDRAPSPGM